MALPDDRPQIMKLAWPLVFGLMAIEFCALAAVFGLYWLLANATVPTPSDTASIRQVIDQQAAAWNRGDLEGYMAGYWNSKELSFYSGGDVTNGWQPTLDRYRKRYQGKGKAMG